jgi:GxxExxY protein
VSSALKNSGPGRDRLEQLTERIIGKAMAVHSALGPGLLESTYEACLAFELERDGLRVERQKILPILYGGMQFDEGYRIDLLVENSVLLELKAVAQVRDVHLAQLLSYLRLSGCSVGLLLNFHVAHLREGIRRVINSSAS